MLFFFRQMKITFFIVLLLSIDECYASEDDDMFSGRSLLNELSITKTFGNDSSSCIIPFRRAGNLILIQASADSLQGNFILDTGCPGLVLNTNYFRHYFTTFAQDEEKIDITGSVSSVTQAVIKKFSFGTLQHYNLEADLVNLRHIESVKGIKILGLIGMQLLSQCEMIIDFKANLIHFHRIGRKESKLYQHITLADTATYQTIPIQLRENMIVVQTMLGGKKIKFVVDSGAESNILNSRLPEEVFDNFDPKETIAMSGTGYTKLEATKGDLYHLVIGNHVVQSMPVMVTNLEKTSFSIACCIDGVLGYDFLSLQKVGFNFLNHKMYLWK